MAKKEVYKVKPMTEGKKEYHSRFITEIWYLISWGYSESLNNSYEWLNRQRSIFQSDKALLKALYLATFEATKKWTLPLGNWDKVYGELSIMYGDIIEK